MNVIDTTREYLGLTADEQERRAYANGDVVRAEVLRGPPMQDRERDQVHSEGYDSGFAAGKHEGYEEGYADGLDDQ